MKKTLTLMALLGGMACAALAESTQYWWQGVSGDPETHTLEGAITTYKHNASGTNYGDTADYDMCWVASACNVIAWWQDRVEENGALIIPEGTPRGYEVFEVERKLWNNVGGYQGNAIQMWMTGGARLQLATADAPQAGLDFAGYYPRLAGAGLGMYNYRNSYGISPETAAAKPAYSHYAYTMIQTQWYRPSSKSYTHPEWDNYERASRQIVDYLDEGWGVVWTTTIHAMTCYGVEVDENGLITKLYNSDNNRRELGNGTYTELSVWGEEQSDGSVKVKTGWAGYQIDGVIAVRTTGIRFLDYDVRVGNNFEGEDESLFSHYCNLIVDGAEDYKLKYDLRDASVEGSPVDAKKVEQYTPDGGLSFEERYTDEQVPTGDLHLRGGKVTLVDCEAGRKDLDGGGRIEGTISFEDSKVEGTSRTLKVDHTDTIAKEINLAATSGTNTLEVTDGNKAMFGKLTGTGDLDKTGTGTAEVTEEVTLKGHINVQAGKFLFGKNVVLNSETTLSVADGAAVNGVENKPVTLSLTSGVHINDGEMTLTTTVNTGATLKGSGTFAAVTVNGGTLVVGNSPGHQEYEGALTLNSGSIEFAVGGLDAATSLTSTGWASGTYSTIEMNGNELVIGENGQILIALGQNALTSMGGEFELALVTGLSDSTTLDLAKLAENTQFVLVDENGSLAQNSRAAVGPQQFSYQLTDGVLMLSSGSGSSGNVPEPATGTLSLLALAGLMARRRRK